MPSKTIRRGDSFRRRASGRVVTVAGFTTKPRGATRSDGVRRARLVGMDGVETRIIASQIQKAYEPVALVTPV